MKERNYKRIPTVLEAEVLSCRVNCLAVVKNISERGVYAKVVHPKAQENFDSVKDFDVHLHLPSGETVKLQCEKKWSCKNSCGSLLEDVGVEINDPPILYMEFVKKLE